MSDSASRFVGERLLSIETYDLLNPAENAAFVTRASAAQLFGARPDERPEALAGSDVGRSRQLRGRLGFVAVDIQYQPARRGVCGYGAISQRLHRPSKLPYVHLEGMRVAYAHVGDYVGAALLEAMVGAHTVSEAFVVDPHDFVGRLREGRHEDSFEEPAIPTQREQHEGPAMTVLDVRQAIGEEFPLLRHINLAFR